MRNWLTTFFTLAGAALDGCAAPPAGFAVISGPLGEPFIVPVPIEAARPQATSSRRGAR